MPVKLSGTEQEPVLQQSGHRKLPVPHQPRGDLGRRLHHHPDPFCGCSSQLDTLYRDHSSPADGVDPASLGFPSYIDSAAEFQMLPYITFNSTSVSAGARPTFEPLGYNGDGTNFNDIFQLFGNVVKVHGNHTLKMGADTREYRWSAYTFTNPSGTYAFTGNYTNSPVVSNTTIFGQDFAQFLLGLPSSGSLDLNTKSTVQSKYLDRKSVV